jgi:Amino acid permease
MQVNNSISTACSYAWSCILIGIQNIFGVIFFIRISWVVGNAGILEGFFIAFICCTCVSGLSPPKFDYNPVCFVTLKTFLTSISLSAVATNGKIHSGGPYFIISRNLNATFGASIGLLFYVGNTIAVSMYTCGACEIFLKYMFQNRVALWGDISESSYFFWHVRIYGTVWLAVLSLCVLIGVKFVSKISPVALVCVLLSILAVFVGIIRTAFVPVDLK